MAISSGDRYLLADTETLENSSQEIVAADFSGYFAKRVLRKPQLLRHQLAGLEFLQLPAALVQMATRFLQRSQVPSSSRQCARFSSLEPDAIFKVVAQDLYAVAHQGGHVDLRQAVARF